MRPRCLVIALALLAAFASDAWGQSQEITPQAKAEQKTNETPASQSAAKTQERKIETAPMAAPSPSPNHSDDKPAAEADQGAKEAAEGTEYWVYRGYRVKITDGLLVLFTLGLVVIGAFQAIFLRGTLKATEVAALGTRESAEALISVESASLFVYVTNNPGKSLAEDGHYDKSESMWGQEADRPGVAYNFKNMGRTPAIIIEIRERVFASPQPPDRTDNPPLRDPMPEELIIEPGKPSFTFVCNSREKFTIGDAVKFQKKKLDIWFDGYIRYDDAFRRRHRLDYMFRYHRGYDRFRLVDFRETIEKSDGA